MSYERLIDVSEDAIFRDIKYTLVLVRDALAKCRPALPQDPQTAVEGASTSFP
jgi:hypothetical protein